MKMCCFVGIMAALLVLVNSAPTNEKPETEEVEVIVVCFFCDKNCKNYLKSHHYEGADTYLEELEEKTNKKFEESSMPIRLDLQHYIWNNRGPIKMSKFAKGNDGDKAFSEGEKNIWRRLKYEQKFKVRKGCGAGFLLISPNDSVFEKTSMQGVATKWGACTKDGYGALKITGELKEMAALLAHEMGHIFGADHDCATVDEAMTDFAEYAKETGVPEMEELIENIKQSCGSASESCTNGDFIMTSTPTAGTDTTASGYPEQFSECSKAYIDWEFKISTFDWTGNPYQTYVAARYDTSCLKHE